MSESITSNYFEISFDQKFWSITMHKFYLEQKQVIHERFEDNKLNSAY